MKDAPLKEALLLLVVLAFFAWPLLVVAGNVGGKEQKVSSEQETVQSLTTTVLVKAAHEFQWFELRRGTEVLGRVEGPELEGEFECFLELHGEVLVVAAFFGEDSPETALQMNVWGEGMPEEVLTFWVQGQLLEEVEVNFHE